MCQPFCFHSGPAVWWVMENSIRTTLVPLSRRCCGELLSTVQGCCSILLTSHCGNFNLSLLVSNPAEITGFLYSLLPFSLSQAKKKVESIYSELIESQRTTALWIAYLLSRIGVGDGQLWLIKHLVWCIINYCSLIFNLNDLYAMLHHGGDTELTQLWEKQGGSSFYTTNTHTKTS